MALQPSKIVCVGRNYREHAKELGNEVPAEPLIFLKPPSSVIRTGEDIVLPTEFSSHVEYEGEIGLVIGAGLKNASEAMAVAGIAGIVAVNDVTARDLQRKDSQWTRAKGFDTFCCVGEVWAGPFNVQALEVVTRLNGEERQRGRSADMVFPIPMLVAYISRLMTLIPGDLIATGTPAGVGRLASGDEVEVELVGFSQVQNRVRD
jgi:2-keto-4-pentenoate hydratase/2-oxohepta-3-ene-1,7-dioic acid hydratase in catechol pathway